MPMSPTWPRTVLGVALLLAAPDVGRAHPGDLDPSFGTGGKVTTAFGTIADGATAVAVQEDGKIVAAGVTDTGIVIDPVAGLDQHAVALARYNADGTLDLTFGTGGKVT